MFENVLQTMRALIFDPASKSMPAGLSGVIAAIFSWGVSAASFEVQTGMDILSKPGTTIEGLHWAYLGRSFGEGLSLGQSFYSAALGDAGGAFFWGYEGRKRFMLPAGQSIAVTGFVGGGGGASQVVGDGLMHRWGLQYYIPLTQTVDGSLGASALGISGGDEATKSLSLGLRWRGDGAKSAASDIPLRSWALQAKTLDLSGSRARDGSLSGRITLAGTEFALWGGPTGEWYLGADGAATGAEGYMQVYAGMRPRYQMRAFSVFMEGAAGFAGGGEVDSGGGLLMNAGLGFAIPVSGAVEAEVVLAAQGYPETRVAGYSLSGRLSQVFQNKRNPEARAVDHKWQFSTGVSQHFVNADYRIASGATQSAPLMQESSVDLFVTDYVYLSGNGQTVLWGDAAGFAIGLIGLGYAYDLKAPWGISIEGHMGAAGGGGVAADGGAIYSMRAEVDYKFSRAIWANLGIGKIATFEGSGMAPEFVTLGLKFPFGAD